MLFKSLKIEYVFVFSFLYDSNDQILIQEASVISMYLNSIGHWTTSPPTPFKQLSLQIRRQNNKKTSKTHFLHWNYGETPIEDLKVILTQLLFDTTRIFVYGVLKVSVMKSLLPNHHNIVNLIDFVCPIVRVFSNLQLTCIQHESGGYKKDSSVCTLTRASLNFVQFIVDNSEIFNLDNA